GVVGEDVPAAERQVLQPGERHEVLDEREARVGALPEAQLLHLRDRPERPREAPSDQMHAGNQRGRHGPESGQENGQPSLARGDLLRELGIEGRPVVHAALRATRRSLHAMTRRARKYSGMMKADETTNQSATPKTDIIRMR